MRCAPRDVHTSADHTSRAALPACTCVAPAPAPRLSPCPRRTSGRERPRSSNPRYSAPEPAACSPLGSPVPYFAVLVQVTKAICNGFHISMEAVAGTGRRRPRASVLGVSHSTTHTHNHTHMLTYSLSLSHTHTCMHTHIVSKLMPRTHAYEPDQHILSSPP